MTDETELNRLMVVANSEGKALAELAGCVDRLHQGEAARAALARPEAPSLRALEAQGRPWGTGVPSDLTDHPPGTPATRSGC